MSSPMTKYWNSVSSRFNERPVRERALLLLTALVLILLVGWELAVAPVLTNNERMNGQIETLLVSQQRLQEQQNTLMTQLENDPSRELQRLLDSRTQRLDRLDADIADTTNQFISPRSMVSLLRTMLVAQDELELLGVALKTPVPVYANSEADEAAPSGSGSQGDARQEGQPLLFAHDVEITLRGPYLDVLDYLERLEAMDERLGWVQLDFDAESYPAGEARIRVRTLSLEQAWLGV